MKEKNEQFSMAKLIEWFKRWRSESAISTPLQNFRRQQEKFKKKYPNYQLGEGTYGMPVVHDDLEGTTLRIGAYCSIASGVQIFLGNHHRTDWVSSYPFPAFFKEAAHIPDFGISRGSVTIGSDVWLCANCTILSGITIGHGAVIGTGAIVTRDVEPYSIVAGNPAKHLRWRFDEVTRLALLDTAWWDWTTSEIGEAVELLCSNKTDEFLAYSRKKNTNTSNKNL
jgi:acetyltransferase-like isoleucine patch superfamily enzyme